MYGNNAHFLLCHGECHNPRKPPLIGPAGQSENIPNRGEVSRQPSIDAAT
jgi:hypothetical protein